MTGDRGGILAATGATVVAVSLVAGAEAAERAFPGANGKIAFVENGSIGVVNADGSSAAVLVRGPNVAAPAWSSEGSRIAYSRGCRIYVANADGSDERPLTASAQCDRDPAWAPTGDRLAFTRRLRARSGVEATVIYVVGLDGRGLRRLTQTGLTQKRLRMVRNWRDDSGPAWSPDGSRIAFARSSATSNDSLFVVMANGSGQRRLTSSTRSTSHFDPTWSPDGTRLAFTKRGGGLAPGTDINVVTADGTGERSLGDTIDPRGALGSPSNPSWSPDGKKICFHVGVTEDLSNVLAVADLEGSTVTVLGDIRGDQPDWQPLPGGPR